MPPSTGRAPSYHVFDLYAAHQGAQAVRTVFSAPTLTWADKQRAPHLCWGLAGSASRREGALTLAVTNPHLTEPREAEIAVRGAAVRSARATVLAARDVHDVNTFEDPGVVVPRPAEVGTDGPLLVFHFPAASLTRLDIVLGA